ncbi:MAG: hypothetical protein AAGI38_00295 [Bacteroidota bacterium]
MKHFPFILLILVLMVSCKEDDPEPEPPANPFDIEIEVPQVENEPPDSSSLVGLHEYIFAKSCAVPGCHDGAFEPDFRTVQSTYSTLVYQPVVKNDLQGTYSYRVIPNDVGASWLHNRVTTDDAILGRMPLYDNPLTEDQVKHIETWINDGAPDMFGNVSALPNLQPEFTGMAAYIQAFGIEYRVDTIKDNEYSPFGTLNNVEMTIWLGLEDDSTAVGDLQLNQTKFSQDPFDFNNAKTLNATFSPTPKVVEDYYGPGQDARFYWKVDLFTGDFPSQRLTFFRYYTRDGSHEKDFEFPRTTSPQAYLTYMSFFVTN